MGKGGDATYDGLVSLWRRSPSLYWHAVGLHGGEAGSLPYFTEIRHSSWGEDRGRQQFGRTENEGRITERTQAARLFYSLPRGRNSILEEEGLTTAWNNQTDTKLIKINSSMNKNGTNRAFTPVVPGKDRIGAISGGRHMVASGPEPVKPRQNEKYNGVTVL